MVAASALQMGYFEPREKRTKQMTARVTPSVYEGVQDLARLWTHLERVKFNDETLEVSPSDVVNRLLEVGLAGAWAEIGRHPKTEAEWSEVLRQAKKLLLDDKR